VFLSWRSCTSVQELTFNGSSILLSKFIIMKSVELKLISSLLILEFLYLGFLNWNIVYNYHEGCTGTFLRLYLISEKSIWKNQIRWTGFLVYFKLDFYCICSLQKSISKLIFAGWKSSLSKLIFTTWFFKNQVQI
jgi:hypothetical protein